MSIFIVPACRFAYRERGRKRQVIGRHADFGIPGNLDIDGSNRHFGISTGLEIQSVGYPVRRFIL